MNSQLKKVLSLSAFALMLTACECTSDVCQQGTEVQAENAVTPGTPEDFKKNVRHTVYFDYDSAALSSDAKQHIGTQATFLKVYPDRLATIEGHCDTRGTREYNLALGQKRARSVESELTKKNGIPAKRIKTVSYGKEKALPGDTESIHAENRRATTIVE